MGLRVAQNYYFFIKFFVVIIVTAKFHGTCKTFTCLVSSTFVFRLRIYFKITFHKIYQITCTLILMLHFKRIAIVKSLRKINSMLFYRQQRKLKKNNVNNIFNNKIFIRFFSYTI